MKRLVGIKYDGEPSLRTISHVKWEDGDESGEWTVEQAKAVVLTGEMVYVPGPAGLAVLSVNTFPDGYEGISSVPIKDMPADVLAKLGIQ